MQNLLSEKGKAVLLVILAVLGLTVTVAAGIVRAFVLPEILLMASLFIAMAYGFSLYIAKKTAREVNETLESLASGVVYFDAEGGMIYFNAAAALMLPELAEGEDSYKYIGTYKKFLAFTYEHSLDIQDQAKLTLDIPNMSFSRLLFREVVDLSQGRIALIQFYQKQSNQIVAVVTDISMMKAHIEEMAAATEESRIMIKAIEASGSGMFIVKASDPKEPIVFLNDSVASLLNKSSESLLNTPFRKMLQENFSEQMEVLTGFINTARTGALQDAIWLKTRRDKNIFWYALHLIYFVEDSGDDFYVGFMSDQTNSKLEQAKLEQSQKLEVVAKLAGGIAHDFNNVLSVIDGYSKIMKRSLDKGQDVSAFFDNIDRGVKRGTEITNRLLTFGQCRVRQNMRLNVSAHLKDFESFLRQMTDYNINMIVSLQETPCYADLAPDSLTQIILILVTNAREAMPSGGDLIISASEASRSQILSFQMPIPKDENFICIQIIDSGTGMDADILNRIYEPFFTTKDHTKNSGLGMSLVYGLVKEMNAYIDIKSTPDVGTSVSVLIPCKPAPEHAFFKKEADKRDPEILKGKTILVVEDLSDLLEMECRLLAERGLRVLRAESGKEALEYIDRDENVDFLLADVAMPGMSGIELSELFLSRRPETKVVLISAYPELAASEMTDDKIILAKPFVFEKLEEVLIECAHNAQTNAYLQGKHHWTLKEELEHEQ